MNQKPGYSSRLGTNQEMPNQEKVQFIQMYLNFFQSTRKIVLWFLITTSVWEAFFLGLALYTNDCIISAYRSRKILPKFQQIHPSPFIIPKNNTAVTIGNQSKHIETICLAKTERWQCYTNTIGQIIVNYKQQVVSDPKLN